LIIDYISIINIKALTKNQLIGRSYTIPLNKKDNSIYNFDSNIDINQINFDDDDDFNEYSFEFEDYDSIIENLQNMIDNCPPGMQAKFAKLISILSQKRNLLKKIARIQNNIDFEDAYNKLIQNIKTNLEIRGGNEDTFDSLLKLAKLREYINHLRKNKEKINK